MTVPTLVEVSDVEASSRFLHACGLRLVARSFVDEVECESLRLLQDAGGLAGVLLVPRSSGPALGIGAGTTITIPVDRVKSTASSAVRSGARLLRSHKLPFPPKPLNIKTPGRQHSPTNSDTERDGPLEGGDPTELTAAGIACVEGPDGIRVLLVDRRLLEWKPNGGAGSSSDAESLSPATSVEGISEIQEEEGADGDASNRASGSENGVVGVDGSGLTHHPLLSGLASLASTAESRTVGPEQAVVKLSRGASNNGGGKHETSGMDRTGDWFTETELLLPPTPPLCTGGDDYSSSPGFAVPPRSNISGSKSQANDESSSGTGGQVLSASADYDDGRAVSRVDNDQMRGSGSSGMRMSPGGSPIGDSRWADGGAVHPAVSGKQKVAQTDGLASELTSQGREGQEAKDGDAGEGKDSRSPARARAGGLPAERPFTQLEVFMLENQAGPLLCEPNSLKPIPIVNEYFTGEALLMMRREPMDRSYAHMFEGKNRMFEVQVQGSFKKEPEGDLYISLEITQKMKLGLMTKSLCKVLLSFGQRLNKRLHYSFGTDDNSELPHIAFPLISSVDSLIRTPPGEEVPTLGKPFKESKESKNRRKNADTSGGFGNYEMGYTYSFSFHSMYVDIANWSTCKIPIMNDMDLHTFWGDSALRIAAYVVKPSPSVRGVTPHVQSELNYVFCVQIRHLSQEEQRHAQAQAQAEEQQQAAYQQKRQDEGREDDEVITQPLLTDREELSPRGRQVSASFWAENDDASDGEGRDTKTRPGQPPRGSVEQLEDDEGDSDDSELYHSTHSPDDDRSSISSPASSTAFARSQTWRTARPEMGDRTSGNPSSTPKSTSGTRTLLSSVSPPLTTRRHSSYRSAVGSDGGGRVGDDAVDGVGGIGGGSAGTHRRAGTTESGLGSWASQVKGLPAPVRRITRRNSVGDGPTAGVGDGALSRTRESGGLDGRRAEGYEDMMLRCPAYVDLYARSPKLQGTWTVFILVKRGGTGGNAAGGSRGEFWLRSPKNLSILPRNLVPNLEQSPRLSRREAKRRKLDAALQMLTAPTHANENKQHQVLVRALLTMESSADRAYRAHSPAPQPPAERQPQGSQTGPGAFVAGIPAEYTIPAPESSDPSPSDSPHESPARSPARPEGFTAAPAKGGSARGMASTRRPSRGWGSGRALTVRKEGTVLRALSEHHLSQQQAVLTRASLTFSRPRKQCLRLSMEDIVNVRVVVRDSEASSDEHDDVRASASSQFIPGMCPVEVHTVGRIHYMLVEGLEEAVAWADAIQAMSSDDGRASPQGEVCLSDPFSQYITKKSCWKATNVWVLNCRRSELAMEAEDFGWIAGCWWGRDVGGEECKFVEDLLEQALELNEDSTREQLIAFLDSVCKLRWMPLEGLEHCEQLSLFLNLYHVMLLHAYFLLGPPGSPLRVASYFTTLCYEVGGDLISMAELEHCILRAKSSLPKQFLSKLIIPTTDYPFALRQPEPRVSFALNCGSASAVPCVAIYRPATVEEQIEDMSTYYLQSTTEVHVAKRTVTLPKIVSWYSDDFQGYVKDDSARVENTSAASLPASSGTAAVSLLHLKQYLTGEKRRQVEELLSDGASVNIRFSNWSWRCRPVTLVEQAEIARMRGE